uniref:Uncharacterized protein n=1 Tax=Trypanosoma vivax (strain Y486) TaxID=1055687 RepID=G0TWM2_TRYVY|nr:hypothetical protein TVY486_0601510 [Trypanosoma vivax Y486]
MNFFSTFLTYSFSFLKRPHASPHTYTPFPLFSNFCCLFLAHSFFFFVLRFFLNIYIYICTKVHDRGRRMAYFLLYFQLYTGSFFLSFSLLLVSAPAHPPRRVSLSRSRTLVANRRATRWTEKEL